MDNQKTGALIAARRVELGLTQKQLAEQLHLSDRTISRWERGVGFPDISLLEPLADALNLSVLELLRGERLETAHPDTELTIRDAARTFGTRFKSTVKRFRIVFTVLSIGIILAAVMLLFLWRNSPKQTDYYSREVSASEALAVCPYALITIEEYNFLQQLLLDEDILSYFTKTAEEGSRMDDYAYQEIRDDVLARYAGVLTINGESADISDSLITEYGNIIVGYTSGNRRCYLEYIYNGTIRKTCGEYLDEDGIRHVLFVLGNENNQEFTLMQNIDKLSYTAP